MKMLTSTADNAADAMHDFVSQMDSHGRTFNFCGEVDLETETEDECTFFAKFTEDDGEEIFHHDVTFYSNVAQTEFWAEIELTY